MRVTLGRKVRRQVNVCVAVAPYKLSPGHHAVFGSQPHRQFGSLTGAGIWRKERIPFPKSGAPVLTFADEGPSKFLGGFKGLKFPTQFIRTLQFFRLTWGKRH